MEDITNITNIINIECNFQNIYRITAKNGLILDLPESNKPRIDSELEYILFREIDINKYKNDYTILNGIVFDKTPQFVMVSFGGLLGMIPLEKQLNLKKLSLAYKFNN